jgi:hypothetical protein
MEFKLTPGFGIQIKIEGIWVDITEEHVSNLSEEDKEKLVSITTLSQAFKKVLPESLQYNTEDWSSQMYNGVISIAQALVGVGGVAIAAPFALIAGIVSEASSTVISILEEAKIKE